MQMTAMTQSRHNTPAASPRPETGLAVLYEPDTHEATVDIIAIHGIGANPNHTWQIQGVNWLQHADMLPSAAPQVRIMRFAYESQWLGQGNIAQHPSAVADHFLSSVRSKRLVRLLCVLQTDS